MKTNQSLKLNMCLNVIKNIMGIIFPLITFPYATRILGIDNIGKYNFSNSIITYFSLLAELGISTYAIREGAKLRSNRNEINKFISEMFTINVVSTLISYFLLMICLITVPKLQNYTWIIIILSISIAFKTIGIEYIYSIYEDYLYITVRTIIFQIISLLMLFCFVKSQDDIMAYSIIYVMSNSGANLFNFLHARKYCSIKLGEKQNLKKHIKPIMILFGMSATIAVYVASDVTILGFLCSDTVVGLYSVSTKIYSIVKTILSAIIVVSIPRLSALLGNDDKEGFQNNLGDIYRILLTFMLPAIIGIMILREPIILLISGKEFVGAASSLSLLSIALFFCMGAWFWGQCVLVPLQKEGFVFKITVLSAIINIVLNFILIPIWKENAAAFTTVLAEGFSYLCCMYYGRKNVKKLGLSACMCKIAIGCIAVCLICIGINVFVSNQIVVLMLAVPASIAVYIIIELLLKNEVIYDVIKTKISKKDSWNGGYYN